MRPAAVYASYYCPPLPSNPGGFVPLPAHVPPLPPLMLEPGHGPDQAGGRVFSFEGYNPASVASWKKTRDGWWVNMDGREPHHFARMRVLEGPAITGVHDLHAWMVPQLLRWHPASGIVSAVPEVLRDYEWQPPAHLVPLMERLRAMVLLGEREDVPIVSDDEATQLAIDILALNYHISVHELTLAGWLDTAMEDGIRDSRT